MKFYLSIFILLILILSVFVLNLQIGAASISIFEMGENEVAKNLILNYRLPKTIAALLAGIALPISGLLLQELFRNPLADPSVLGITSASGLGVAMVIFLSSLLGFGSWLNNSWLICLASFCGAMFALITIVFFSSRLNSTTSLIIIGMMLAGFSAALIGIMQFFAPSEKIKSYIMWTFGSMSGLSWSQMFVFGLSVLMGIIISIFTLKGISGMRLGENYAQTMGINIKKTRWLILISSAILTASATAFVGPVAFIGLAVPHICRMVFKKTQIVGLYILVVLLGIFLMLLFSWIAQLFPSGSLPINIITSLIGAPIVMSIVLNQKRFIND
ncbi:FecCD family ABC transporter permease [Moheibacter sediminis]|uniref:Iron complex transport system permease protein n=1 Tax=Moheibacter sediminis TaxID=1434700 RepID=A0A1W2AYG6_9FLAO|nr:iron ABC transporter permease [Moheibacter sediminis]SMC65218.1 iron complex transport system permease protein [Moheibacter sediminis]